MEIDLDKFRKIYDKKLEIAFKDSMKEYMEDNGPVIHEVIFGNQIKLNDKEIHHCFNEHLFKDYKYNNIVTIKLGWSAHALDLKKFIIIMTNKGYKIKTVSTDDYMTLYKD